MSERTTAKTEQGRGASGLSRFAPYGAFELKATYQRNFLTAQIFTIATVGLALLTAALWPTTAPVTTVIDIPPRGGTISLPPQVSVVVEYDPGPSVSAAPDLEGIIPVPVADEFLADAADRLIPTQLDLATGRGNGDEGSENRGIVIDTAAIGSGRGDPWPSRTEFVPREIEPELVYRYTGEYPRTARRMGLTGTAAIRLLIDEEGRVIASELARSSGVEILDETAVAWGLRCRFSPAIQNDHPIKLWVIISYQFTLDE